MGNKWEQCASSNCTRNRVEPAALCNACLAAVYGQLQKPGTLVQPVGNLEDQDLPPEPKPKQERPLLPADGAVTTLGRGRYPNPNNPLAGPGCRPGAALNPIDSEPGFKTIRGVRVFGPPVPLPFAFMLRAQQRDFLKCNSGDAEIFIPLRMRIRADNPVLLCGAMTRSVPQLPFQDYNDAGLGVLTDSYDVPGGVEVDFSSITCFTSGELSLRLQNPHDREINGVVELWGHPASR